MHKEGSVLLVYKEYRGRVLDCQLAEYWPDFQVIYALGNIDEMIAEDEAVLGSNIIKYWKLVALHGEYIRKARLEWVEKAIAILESEGESH